MLKRNDTVALKEIADLKFEVTALSTGDGYLNQPEFRDYVKGYKDALKDLKIRLKIAKKEDVKC